MTTVIGLLIAAAVLYWAWSRYFPRIQAALDARRDEREAEHDRIERKLREIFSAPATQPTDIVDGPVDRSAREIHGMTASELTELNAAFNDITGREWPKQT